MLERNPIARRTITFALGGAMQCPRCSYALSYSDVLLCRVGETHYCPRCWSRIEEVAEVAGGKVSRSETESRLTGDAVKTTHGTTGPNGAGSEN